MAAPPRQKPRILIIDDDPDLRNALAELVESEGYEAITADDGNGALATIAVVGRVDLVIVDQLMPGMDGAHFIEEFRRRGGQQSTPVIVLSGMAAAADLPEDVDVLLKPPDAAELLAVAHARVRRPASAVH